MAWAPARRCVTGLLGWIVAGWLCLPAAAQAAGTATLEAGVKAAFLYKFLAYIEWPPAAFVRPDAPLVIGVAGAEAVYNELQQMLQGRAAQGHPVTARRVAEGDSVDGLHMLFVGRAGTGVTPPWAQRLDRQPTVLVTEQADGLRLGATLNFLLADGRVRFEASLPEAERAGVKLSARLLAVAERVETP